MPARAAVHTLLEDDVDLQDIGSQAVYASNSVDTPAEEVFLIIKWETTTSAFKSRGRDRVSIWAHDRQRDYGRIDKLLHRVRELLTDTVQRAGGDGWTMTLAEWDGEGPDLVDGGFDTITRFADFTVVSRYTTTES